mmetsp:Transcript_60695/g.72054  ORF Transcript_60695/g.72054 Transcript_60695/m.72054 type:complete len:564 (-) Transcript_60695:122-1813(-)
MRGKLISVDGTTVKIKPMSADLGLTSEVEFLASQVRKHIAEGAHVKVIDGHYANETGTVVAVDSSSSGGHTAIVLTDLTHKEISVRVAISTGRDKLAGYELHDLVVLSGGGNNEVGVIVRVGREEFSVVNNHGIVRDVRPEELRGKRNLASQRAMALDVQGNQIKCGDSVSIAEGPHKGKTASIKRMSRSMLFLYHQARTENAGIFVVRSRSCVLAGNRRSHEKRVVAGGGMGRGRGPPRGGKSDDGMIGKTVRVQSGAWKGYLGVVTDATPTHVQVELHSRLKKVMVVRERVAVIGDKFGATEPRMKGETESLSSSTNGGGVASTPFLGGQTPMHGAATPMHDSAGAFTPSHPSTGTDDVWRPGGSIDRAPVEEEDERSDVANPWGPSGNDDDDDSSFLTSTTADTAGGGWATSSSPDSSSNTWTTSTSSPQYGTTKTEPQNRSSLSDDHASSSSLQPPVWFVDRVYVTTKSSQTGVIREIHSDKSASVELLDDKSRITVRPGEVSMVAPKEHDMVLVTGGADVGVEGELVCIDGTDAILKDGNDDFKIVEFFHLAKIESDS